MLRLKIFQFSLFFFSAYVSCWAQDDVLDLQSENTQVSEITHVQKETFVQEMQQAPSNAGKEYISNSKYRWMVDQLKKEVSLADFQKKVNKEAKKECENDLCSFVYQDRDKDLEFKMLLNEKGSAVYVSLRSIHRQGKTLVRAADKGFFDLASIIRNPSDERRRKKIIDSLSHLDKQAFDNKSYIVFKQEDEYDTDFIVGDKSSELIFRVKNDEAGYGTRGYSIETAVNNWYEGRQDVSDDWRIRKTFNNIHGIVGPMDYYQLVNFEELKDSFQPVYTDTVTTVTDENYVSLCRYNRSSDSYTIYNSQITVHHLGPYPVGTITVVPKYKKTFHRRVTDYDGRWNDAEPLDSEILLEGQVDQSGKGINGLGTLSFYDRSGWNVNKCTLTGQFSGLQISQIEGHAFTIEHLSEDAEYDYTIAKCIDCEPNVFISPDHVNGKIEIVRYKDSVPVLKTIGDFERGCGTISESYVYRNAEWVKDTNDYFSCGSLFKDPKIDKSKYLSDNGSDNFTDEELRYNPQFGSTSNQNSNKEMNALFAKPNSSDEQQETRYRVYVIQNSGNVDCIVKYLIIGGKTNDFDERFGDNKLRIPANGSETLYVSIGTKSVNMEFDCPQHWITAYWRK